MKINQFAKQKLSYEQEIAELKAIKFINTEILQQTPTQAFYTLLQQSFPECHTTTAKNTKIAALLATPAQNAYDYLQTKQITVNAFYNIYFQLLGLKVGIDFDPEHPLALKSSINYPVFPNNILQTADILHGWYQLLITHTVHGQTFLDELASRGYFQKLIANKQISQPLFFNGKAQAVFDTTKLIHEVVYVESNLDSDHDGQLDLLKAEVIRPVETNTGLKVPVLYTASPYNQGTNDEIGQKLTHNVNQLLAPKTPCDNTVTQSAKANLVSDIQTRTIQSETTVAEETFGSNFTYSLNDYFLARGFAVVYAAGIGTKDSDGLRTCGDDQETMSTIAIIEWLNGTRTAFTNRTDNIAIKAWWCNQNIAMTGKSYLGTLAIAAATTGVTGLKTIIAEAGISSWYDYYREHGLVVAPGGFPGEDADVLAAETFSRQQQAGNYLTVKKTWQQQLQRIQKQQDRTSGDYNNFWDERNYRHNVAEIKADLILVHGLNDWNVKPKNAFKLWQALDSNNISKKLILHQGPHIYINNFRSLDFTDMMNLWLSNKLYGIANQAEQILPDVLIQDNTKPETWLKYTDWGNNANKKSTFFLAPNKLTPTSTSTKTVTFSDQLSPKIFKNYTKNFKQWREDLVATQSNNLDNNRLIFQSNPLSEPLIIDGRPIVKLRVASSQNVGLISIRLIDYGRDFRLQQLPTILETQAFDLGFHYQKETLKDYQLATEPTNSQLISFAHLNLQNREKLTKVQTITPEQFYDVKIPLQPTHYQIKTGHQLGLIVYATDMEMTIRANQNILYSLTLSNCSLTIPHL
ncbi:Xaa-Pro dipeptidyl-peptidase [Bombilactobacillus thymidiniphilus]|uniref:Xaa-Pro dipeptidyl-peptidase n=1 Tax=Bombilactobacillus thymidiniphilus TaxID=2923363 RepID=A0ABY4PD33_9LACO|nr:Xaa-Pro dipeptidyl-peptidase [Bombilactobacillus thymidiniphilus]UQS83437.1 Xaa-Pro dipeptidyl-peptidase [Bombilactobacillus thymidiniphilus]